MAKDSGANFVLSAKFADQAVRDRHSEDRLGRKHFAEQVGKAILGWREPQSLVMSLTGPWGSGKTTIKNFVVQFIDEQDPARRPDVLEFTPWQITDRTALLQRFFEDVGLKLRRRDKEGEGRAAERRWAAWAASLGLVQDLSPFPSGFLSVPAAALGGTLIVFGALSDSWITRAFSTPAGIVLLLLAAAVGYSAKAAAGVQRFFAGRAQANAKTVDELRKELEAELEKRDRPLVIVIDEIDRLLAPEIRLMCQLVKACGSFPKMVFVLVFEQEVVQRALTDEAHSGQEYLEKIVQIPFSMPQVDRAMLNDAILREVNAVLKDLPSANLDERRWWNMFAGGVDAYVHDLRDLYRYVATFHFYSSMLRADDSMEVNIVDLLGVEVLRAFEPTLYNALPIHRRLLLEGPGQTYSGMDRRSEAKSEFESLISLAVNPGAARRILRELFVPIAWLLDNYSYSSSFDREWSRALRICDDAMFNRYFQMAVPSDDIANAAIEQLVRESHDINALTNRLKKLDDAGKLFLAIDRLSMRIESIEASAARNFTRVLFDLGDSLPERAPITGLPGFWFAEGFLRRVLLRVEEPARRSAAIFDALQSTSGLFLPSALVIPATERDESGQTSGLVPEDEWQKFRDLLVHKYREAASAGTLAGQRHLGNLLHTWVALDSAGARAWAERLADSPEGAFLLLRTLVTPVRAQVVGDVTSRLRYEARLDSIDKIVSIQKLESQLATISATGEDAKILKAFRRALTARAEGKTIPPLGWIDDDE